MRDTALPAALLCATSGLTLGFERAGVRVPVCCALAMAVVGIWYGAGTTNDGVFAAAWAVIGAAGVVSMLGPVATRIVGITLAAAARLVTGLLTTSWPLLAILVVLPVTGLLARSAVGRGWPMAVKVVAGWLLATAMLNATLTMLPVTPGYSPDHLE